MNHCRVPAHFDVLGIEGFCLVSQQLQHATIFISSSMLEEVIGEVLVFLKRWPATAFQLADVLAVYWCYATTVFFMHLFAGPMQISDCFNFFHCNLAICSLDAADNILVPLRQLSCSFENICFRVVLFAWLRFFISVFFFLKSAGLCLPFPFLFWSFFKQWSEVHHETLSHRVCALNCLFPGDTKRSDCALWRVLSNALQTLQTVCLDESDNRRVHSFFACIATFPCTFHWRNHFFVASKQTFFGLCELLILRKVATQTDFVLLPSLQQLSNIFHTSEFWWYVIKVWLFNCSQRQFQVFINEVAVLSSGVSLIILHSWPVTCHFGKFANRFCGLFARACWSGGLSSLWPFWRSMALGTK